MSELQSAQKEDHPERFDPEGSGGELTEAEHRARYRWVLGKVTGREVLDAGCGTGHGLATLASGNPSRLVGVDLAEDALARARTLAPMVDDLAIGDVRSLPFGDASFDVVVCFEVIEHIDRPDDALDEMRRVLRQNGTLFISSPNRDVQTPGNPHHVHEYTPEELRAALERRFPHVVLFAQRPRLATTISPKDVTRPGSPARWSISSIDSAESPGEAHTLAMAGGTPVESPGDVMVLGSDFEVRWWHEQLDSLRRSEAAARLEYESLRSTEDRNRADLQEASRRVLDLEQKLAGLAAMEFELSRIRADAAEVEMSRRIVRDMKSSPSWRITAPLRALKRLLR